MLNIKWFMCSGGHDCDEVKCNRYAVRAIKGMGAYCKSLKARVCDISIPAIPLPPCISIRWN